MDSPCTYNRYKILIEYLGSGTHGWQKQNNVLSIQQILEDAIAKLVKHKVALYVAGRTDAGVHAYKQVTHFDLPLTSDIADKDDCYKFMHSINYFVRPHKIGIKSCELVSHQFHARFSATARHYVYKIINRPSIVIINAGMVHWVKIPLNVNSMREAAKHLIGRHDFSAFRSSQCQAKSPIKTVDTINIEHNFDEINIFVSAPSFLHHMVRNIVGTLMLVGHSKLAPDDVKQILLSKDRSKAGYRAPAHGLYLIGVDYD